MWLTLHFSWSVYLCVYIYAHPPHGPCPPAHHGVCSTHMRHMQRMCKRILCTHPHHVRKTLHFQWVISKGKLLCNQLPCFSMKKRGGFSRQGCVAEPMHILNLSKIDRLSNIGQWEQTVNQPHEFHTRASKYIWNIFLQPHVKRRRQRITRGWNHLLYLSMLQIVYYLSL